MIIFQYPSYDVSENVEYLKKRGLNFNVKEDYVPSDVEFITVSSNDEVSFF